MDEKKDFSQNVIREFGPIAEQKTDVVNTDGRFPVGETSMKTAESYLPPVDNISSLPEANANSSSLPKKSPKADSADSIKKVFSIKALAGSVVSVAAVTAITVAAVLTSVILNVALFAATAFSLTFQLDINYEKDDVLTAVLTKEDFRDEIVLDGDEYVTFNGLTPETEYVFSILRSNGEVLYSATYRTEKEGESECSLWVNGRQNDDLLLGVEFYSENLPDFYTVTVLTKGGRQIFAEDRVPLSPDDPDSYEQQESSGLLVVPDYPFEETCFITVKANGKGVACLTVWSPADYGFSLVEAVPSSEGLSLSLIAKRREKYFYATVEDKYASLSETEPGSGSYSLSFVGLNAATQYECVVYTQYGLPVFSYVFTTTENTEEEPYEEPVNEEPDVHPNEPDNGEPEEVVSVSLVSADVTFDTVTLTLSVNNPSDENIEYALNGEACDVSTDENGQAIWTASSLAPHTEYAFTVASGNKTYLSENITTDDTLTLLSSTSALGETYSVHMSDSFKAYLSSNETSCQYELEDSMGNLYSNEMNLEEDSTVETAFFTYTDEYTLKVYVFDLGESVFDSNVFTVTGQERPTFSIEYSTSEEFPTFVVTLLSGELPDGELLIHFVNGDGNEISLPFTMTESVENVSLADYDFVAVAGTYDVAFEQNSYTVSTATLTVE